jgi:hypothetical protein
VTDYNVGTEAEAMSDWLEGEDEPRLRVRFRAPSRKKAKDQSDRWRCLTVGCNPTLNSTTAATHRDETSHRVAAWPVRSAEGRRRAAVRNRTGYYDRYNVGAKSPEVRGIGRGR